MQTTHKVQGSDAWERIAERVSLATAAAVTHGATGQPISVENVSRLHEIIFSTTFPKDAARA
jgi:hypothetical protein